MVTLCPSFAKGSSESTGDDESISLVQHLPVAAPSIGQRLEPDRYSRKEYTNQADPLAAPATA